MKLNFQVAFLAFLNIRRTLYRWDLGGGGEVLPLAAECVVSAQNAVFGRQAEQDFQGFGSLGGADDAH